MAHNFIECDRDQALLMPPDLREWLPSDHLAWFVIEATEEMDLSALLASYREDGWGRAAHDPQMMLALVLYSYAIGERSARRIERRCHEDVAFRVITSNQAPDHATIARFRCRHEAAIATVFDEVLALCQRAGMLNVGQIALDSTKLGASAAGNANLGYRQIAEKILSEAGEVDSFEDELYGDQRGDELPQELSDPVSRKRFLREAKRQLRAERHQEPGSERPASSRTERLEQAKLRLERQHARARSAERDHHADRSRREAEAEAKGQKLSGVKPTVSSHRSVLGDQPLGQVNVTDPDSQPVSTPRGFIQGYNAQAVTTAEQVIVAAEVTLGSADQGQLEPMIDLAAGQIAAAGASKAPRAALADAGYWSAKQIDALKHRGIEALVPPDGKSRQNPRRRAGAYEEMRRRLDSEQGAEIYRQRQWMVEPVFSQVKVGRRIDAFLRRGLAACRSEWRLIAATHNLLKLWRASIQAPPPASVPG